MAVSAGKNGRREGNRQTANDGQPLRRLPRASSRLISHVATARIDPVAHRLAAGLLLVVLLASLVPARRPSAIDPTVALRRE